MRRRGSHRTGTRLSSPFEKPAPPAPPPFLLTPTQAERLSELLLANFFAVSLLIFWHARTDPTVVERFAGWVAPGLSKSARRQAQEQFDPASEDDEAEDSFAVLAATTDWYTSLQLPTTRAELWSGPPMDGRPCQVSAPTI